MAEIYRTAWRVTGRQQVPVIVLALIVAALAAVPLKFQQLIVNHLAAAGDVGRLLWLCAGLLAAVAASATCKFLLNYRIASIGEQVVALIRKRLYTNAVFDTQSRAPTTVDRGALVTMMSAEAEAVGAFAGSAFASPLVQIGTLISVIGFILVQEPWLGVFVLAVVAPQSLVVSATQRRVNLKVRERVLRLRQASNRLSTCDFAQIDDRVMADFDEIYAIRRRIFWLKRLTKFAMTMISAGGTVGVLLLGGLLVLDGRTDLGTVVASLTGLARIEGPWRELVAFFRSASTVQVTYSMIVCAVRAREAGG
jgi:ABC-type multidrug transport system fused ATPase/permease subunit